jgi:RecB family exonuclease
MYIKLGGKDVFKTSVVKPGYGRGNPKPAPSLPELIESTWQNLAMRLMQHREGAFPFISHYRVKNRDHEGEYDHLARFKEWSATGGADDEGNDPVDDDKEEAA